MSAPGSVLGVLGLCWAGIRTQHSESPRNPWVLDVCVGCVGFSRARARAHKNKCMASMCIGVGGFSLYARTEQPNTPNTPNTDLLNALILLVFKCVGCVLGCGFLCRVAVFGRGTAR